GVLTISGEKKEQREEKDKGFMFTERSYGRFERRVQLPSGADEDKIEAHFENGVLTLDIPRSEQSDKRKRITINKA
ncbi:MAG TPA: Hsp20/alpha crystallin family protein, partial [Rhizorhapis sp.]|nr:Hsp20/alpha crystallin family protein [Rhizorhapis sp.]